MRRENDRSFLKTPLSTSIIIGAVIVIIVVLIAIYLLP